MRIAKELQKDGRFNAHRGKDHKFEPLTWPGWEIVSKCKYCEIMIVGDLPLKKTAT